MNTKIITLLLLLAMPLGLTAQSVSREVTVNGMSQGAKEQAVDKVQYRVTYKALAATDTTQRDSTGGYAYSDDEMRLDIGRRVSKFYSGREAAYEKWMSDQMEKGATDFRNGPALPEISWVVYRNYPEGETSFLDRVFMNSYRVSEKTVSPQWTLDTDTCTILGYPCTKAVSDFKGRHWTAWFAEDIPLDHGPWKLFGLPGLILKAEDGTRQYSFTAIGLEQVGGLEDITLVKGYKKYEPVSQKQLDKISRTTTVMDAFAARGIKFSEDVDVKVVSSDGSADGSSFKKKLSQASPYNPIEIAE